MGRARGRQQPKRGQYSVPARFLFTADTPEQAYEEVSKAVGERQRLHPEHPIRVEIGPASEVQIFREDPHG